MPDFRRQGWQLGSRRVLFPLIAFLLVAVARPVLAQWQHVNLLHVAVPLLGSMALVQAIFQALRHVLPPGSLLAGFERTIAGSIWVLVALHILGFLPDVLAFLEGVGFSVGRQHLSLLLALKALCLVLATLLGALWVSSAIETRLMAASRLDTSLRVMLARLSKALLTVLAVLIVMPLVGIDLTVLSVFGGALGVGLGLGLQKIASNYVSGFILLLDRSVRLEDFLTVGDFYGRVVGITTRYVVLRNPDGREAIVPNEQLVSSMVISHTHTDRKLRLSIQVQVASDTDVEHAIGVLQAVARSHPRVLESPAPACLLLEFADSGINLELGFWIVDPEAGRKNVRSEIARQALLALRRERIEIPFPQREIRLIRQRQTGIHPGDS